MTHERRLAPQDPIVWRSPFLLGATPSTKPRAGVFLDHGPAPFVTVHCHGDTAVAQVRGEQVLHRSDYSALHAIAPDTYPSPTGHRDERFERLTADTDVVSEARPVVRLSDIAPASAEGGTLLVDILAALATYGIPVSPLPGPTDPSAIERAGCVAAAHGDHVLVTWAFPTSWSRDLSAGAERLLEGIALLLASPRDERGPLYVVEPQRDQQNVLLGPLLTRAHPR